MHENRYIYYIIYVCMSVCLYAYTSSSLTSFLSHDLFKHPSFPNPLYPLQPSLTETTTRTPQLYPCRVNIANPPSLLLAVEALLDILLEVSSAEKQGQGAGAGAGVGVSVGMDGTVEAEQGSEGTPTLTAASAASAAALLPSLLSLRPSFHRWVQWMLATQKGQRQGSFRWRGRSNGDGKVLFEGLWVLYYCAVLRAICVWCKVNIVYVCAWFEGITTSLLHTNSY